jgi:hypothetical protein
LQAAQFQHTKSKARNTHAFLPTHLEFSKSILVQHNSHIVFDLLRSRYALNSGVRIFCYVLFALMQKERKKSRPKDASTHMPTRHPAFGPGHRAALLNITFVTTIQIVTRALSKEFISLNPKAAKSAQFRLYLTLFDNP